MHSEITYEWNIVGHQQVKRLLDLQMQNGAVAQSYLFVGPGGVGKRMLAREFAERLAGSNTDVIEFNFATQGVEDLRQLLQRIALRPASGAYQVVVFDGVEHMQLATSNALLKTLEEPPASTILILVSSRMNVPATIVSRCQNIQFGNLTELELQSVIQGLSESIDENMIKSALGIPSRLHAATRGAEQEMKFAKWERELTELIASSVLSRVVRSSVLATEEVSDLEDRIRYWLEYFMQPGSDAKLLSRRLKVLQESFTRLQKNGNRKMVMEYLCLNI